MGWGGLISVIGRVPTFAQRNDDDAYDRLNHRWTTAILIAFAVMVTTKTYIRDSPISCWAPKEFGGAWKKYANSYCWVSNTYYLPFEQDIPRNPAVRSKTSPIIYYQWVPLILLVQALMCYAPVTVWRGLNNRTGIDANDLVETAEKYQYSGDPDVRDKVMLHLLKQMHRAMKATRLKPPVLERGLSGYGDDRDCCETKCCWAVQRSCLCAVCHKGYGNYMTILYFVLKLLFLANSVGQVFMMNWFLGNNYTLYGYDVFNAFLDGEDWTEKSVRFPRVTLCDIAIRRLGNVHWYTLQCVLPINLFNERIYLILWFWFFTLSLLNVIGLFSWIIRLGVPALRKQYIKNHLIRISSYHAIRNLDQNSDQDQKQTVVEGFVHDYLRPDGVLLMKLIDLNTNDMTMQDFLGRVWDHYKSRTRSKSSGLLYSRKEEV